MKRIISVFIICVVFLMTLASTLTTDVHAAAKNVQEYAKEVSSDEVTRLTLDLSTVQTDNISKDPNSPTDMIEGTAYSAVYPKALDYFGKKLTVKVEATLDSFDKDSSVTQETQIYIKNGLVCTQWTNAYNAVTKWKVSILDGDQLYSVPLLFGINDPDESNYLYSDANTREMYYIDAGISIDSVTGLPNASQAFVVESDGLYHVDEAGNKTDPATDRNVSVYDDALFLISMNNEPTFSFDSVTYKNGAIWVPEFYSLKGKWKVEYVLNDSEEYPADNSKNVDPNAPTDPTKSFIEYESGVGFERKVQEPTREGYKFLGWTRDDLSDATSEDNYWVKKYDFGNKKFIAQWEAEPQDYVVEYYYMDDQGEYPLEPTSSVTRQAKTAETVTVTNEDKVPTKSNYVLDESEKATPIYEEVVKPDGTTVLKVYFKKSYTVTYKPGTQGTFTDQVNPNLDHGVKTPSFEGTPTGNPGYDFVGWDVQIADTVTKDAVYVAQWEPWKYYIKYDGNGGSGIMDRQTFTYDSGTMTSKDNEFTRSGYRFTGFKYEYKGNVRIIRSPEDFKALLLELGPNSEILLIAQWEKIPQGYVAPVTGVE